MQVAWPLIMQRALQAGTRASCRGCSARRDANAEIRSAAAVTDASASLAASSRGPPSSSEQLSQPDKDIPVSLSETILAGAHRSRSTATESSTPWQLTTVAAFAHSSFQSTAMYWHASRKPCTGSALCTSQHLFSPVGACAGHARQAYASAAQAASAPQQQPPFAVRQVSNERPAALRQPRGLSAGQRSAIVARLARRCDTIQCKLHCGSCLCVWSTVTVLESHRCQTVQQLVYYVTAPVHVSALLRAAGCLCTHSVGTL